MSEEAIDFLRKSMTRWSPSQERNPKLLRMGDGSVQAYYRDELVLAHDRRQKKLTAKEYFVVSFPLLYFYTVTDETICESYKSLVFLIPDHLILSLLLVR